MDGGTTEIAGGGRSTVVEDLGGLEGWSWNSSGIALWSFVLFGAFLLNATLLLAFLKRPGLRTISNRFVMNLTVSNLLTCAILNPMLMLDGPSSSTASSTSTTCAIAEGATALVTTSSILSVLLIAVDQYFAVVDPLRYRTRIDKLKCGILTISVWFVSIVFGLLASMNPNPRSVWLVCEKRYDLVKNLRTIDNYTSNEIVNWTINSNLRLTVNTSEDYNREDGYSFAELDEDVSFYDNTSTTIIQTETIVKNTETIVNATNFTIENFQITYGFCYAVAYAILGYLLPFAGVCWIYVSIYSAAHKNSERTRRTGSRPILSSGSFSEEYYPVRQDVSTDDFRRIPKISSLSSIDESIETLTPSQISPRRNSDFSKNRNNEIPTTTNVERTNGIIFTVGSSKLDVTKRSNNVASSINDDHTKDDKDNYEKVPIAVLRAQFLGNNEISRTNDDLVRSKFRDEPNQKRKSSHDLMYEEMLRKDLEKLRELQRNENENASTDDDDDDDDQENDEDDGDDDDENEKSTEARMLEKNSSSSSRDVEPIVNDDTTTKNTSSVDEIVKNDEISSNNENVDSHVDSSTSKNFIDDNVDTRIVNSKTNVDCSTRKNSLDYNVGNISCQSSILKTHQNCLLNVRTNFRNSHVFHRSDYSSSMNYDDNIYVKSSNGNYDVNNTIFGVNSTNTPIVTITPPNRPSLQRVSSTRSTSSYINSLKHRISNGSLFKYREETRAARISALVIVMGLICWTPYVVVILLKNISSYVVNLPHGTDVAAMSFLILAAYVTPLLFGYRSRRVKRELRKLFCFRRELSYKNNRSLMAKKVLKRRQSGNLSQLEMDAKYNIFNCVYGRTRWPKDKVQFVQVPETALVVETCRSSFSSGASTQISSTSTEEC